MHISDYIESLIKKDIKIIMIIFGILLFSQSVLAEIDLMGLTLDVKQSGIDVSSGNISVEIYDDASAGSLIYNSSNAFLKEADKKGELDNG